MHGRLTPLQSGIDALEYCYTKLCRSTPHQSSIDALNTATSNLADLLAEISGKPLHYISFIYSTIHIYPWQIDPTPSSNRP